MNKISYICVDCASKHDGNFPEDFAATAHVGICDICCKEVTLFAVDDFDYPKGKPSNFSYVGRD